MEKPREYHKNEEIQSGDVVCNKGSPYAFNTCIVTYTEEKTSPVGLYTIVHLERSHMVVTASGTAFVSTERVSVEEMRFRGEYRVWTTGASGKKDNRLTKRA
jgi:hypothetical protein